jgi:hypothetical protein
MRNPEVLATCFRHSFSEGKRNERFHKKLEPVSKSTG